MPYYSSSQNISSTADAFGIYTYKDDLIWYLIEDHENWQHRELAVRKDHYCKTYITKLDEEIWAEKPITTPDIFGKSAQDEMQPEEPEIPNPIQLNGSKAQLVTNPEGYESETLDISDEWDYENWGGLFSKMFDKSRTHSYSVVTLYDTYPFWRVFYEREITEIESDSKGQPVSCVVEWSIEMPKTDKFLNFKETIKFFNGTFDELEQGTRYGLLVPFGTPSSHDELGEYDLDDKWSLDVYMRYCNLDIVNNSGKTSGFYFLKYGTAIDPTSQQSLANAFDIASACRSVGAKETTLQDIEAVFPQKPEFTVMAMDHFRREFAMSCRLPLEYFRSEGETSNALLPSTQNETKVNKKKQHLFGKFKPYIKMLIFMRWGIKLDEIEPFIYETEMEQLNITPMDRFGGNQNFNQNQNNEVTN